MGFFYRKKAGVRELLTKEKERIILGPGHPFFGSEEHKGFYRADGLSLLRGMEKAHVTGYLTGAWPENSRLVG